MRSAGSRTCDPPSSTSKRSDPGDPSRAKRQRSLRPEHLAAWSHRGERALQVFDAVDETRPQLIGFARRRDVGEPGEEFAVHDGDLPAGQVGAEAEVGPSGPET